MKLVTVRTPDGLRAGRLEGDSVTLLPYSDVGAVLASGDGWRERASGGGEVIPVAGARMAPVVPRPSKIICLGLNYRTHIKEMGREMPAFPTLFAKFAEALIGPNEPIILPAAADSVDWEGELAVIVGKRVRNADLAAAASAIAGFTVCNDVSMRDWQRRTLQWLQGKTWEATTPLGPALVTTDEAGGASPDLRITVTVDGESMQDARTGDLVFSPAECISYISTIITLNPGDVISTGTPGGVGDARDPQVFLRAGQVVRTSVEGIGTLVNECVAEPTVSEVAAPASTRQSVDP